MEPAVFLRERFQSFYASQVIPAPPAVAEREFGIGEFGRKISQRHLSFSSDADFRAFLTSQAPLFVSYSAAHYQNPAARPMEAKVWNGSDLVFEFDCDDLKTPCKETHDRWQCSRCTAFGKGNVAACSQCGAGTVVDQWVCPTCLNAVKKQVLVLADLLSQELGFSSGLSLNFSGSKGFHVHVRSELARKLSPEARIEVLDFLSGYHLDLSLLGFVEDGTALRGPRWSQAKGWQKRVLNELLKRLDLADASEWAVAGNISVRSAEKLLEKKAEIKESIQRGLFPSWISKKPSVFWLNVLTFCADDLKLDVDRQTSLDKFKIVRVPETLHGSTGLQAKSLSLDALSSFDALSQGVVFGEKEWLVCLVLDVPRFWLGNAWWGPWKAAETVVVPEFVAVLLVARGTATVSLT